MIYIIDSSAMIAMVKGEEGAQKISSIIDNRSNKCFAHVINLYEVYYGFRRQDGENTAESVIQDLISVGIIPCEDMDFNLWRQAGKYKADFRKISLADCFCLALADRLQGTVLTSDHHEFDYLTQLNIVDIEFFR